MRVWVCSVTEDSYTCVGVQSCKWGICVWTVACVSLCTQDGGKWEHFNRSRHWIKTQNAITFPALSILINVTMNLHPNGPSSAYKSSTVWILHLLVGSSHKPNLTVDLEVHGSIIQLGLTFRH